MQEKKVPEGVQFQKYTYAPEINRISLIIRVPRFKLLEENTEFSAWIHKLQTSASLNQSDITLLEKLVKEAPSAEVCPERPIQVQPTYNNIGVIIEIGDELELLTPLKKDYENRHKEPRLINDLAYYVLPDVVKSYELLQNTKNQKRLSLHDSLLSAENQESFLLNKSRLLLLQGESGAGKSLSLHYLEDCLWHVYQGSNDSVLKEKSFTELEITSLKRQSYIPLYIDLKGIRDKPCDKNLVEWYLAKQSYTPDKIQILKAHYRFIFLFDAYDEMAEQVKKSNIYQQNQLSHWNTKVIITCRSQYLNQLTNYQLLFNTDADHNQSSLQEFCIAPFSQQQIFSYLDRKVELNTTLKNDENFKNPAQAKEFFKDHSQLLELVTNPLLLHMVVMSLTNIYQALQKNSAQSINRSLIYKASIRQWFDRELQKLNDIDTEKALKLNLTPLSFQKFAQELAFQMFKLDKTEVRYESAPQELICDDDEGEDENGYEVIDSSTWEKFFGQGKLITQKRMACPLSYVNSHYSFYHKSFLEYFVACHLHDNKLGFGGKGSESIFKKILGNLIENDLNQTLLMSEPAIIEFLAEMIQENSQNVLSDIKQKRLFQVVTTSKNNKKVAVAAANAITVLNYAKVPFSGKDLSNIKIKRADLTGALLDNTNLIGSNLKSVKLIEAFLYRTSLKNSKMKDVDLGERPSLEHGSYVKSIACSADGKWIASISHNVKFWNLVDGTIMCEKSFKKIEDFPPSIFNAAISSGVYPSPSGKRLAFIKRNRIEIWKLPEVVSIETIHEPDEVIKVSFFEAEDEFYLASLIGNGTVKIRRFFLRSNGTFEIEFKGFKNILIGQMIYYTNISLNKHFLAWTYRDTINLWKFNETSNNSVVALCNYDRPSYYNSVLMFFNSRPEIIEDDTLYLLKGDAGNIIAYESWGHRSCTLNSEQYYKLNSIRNFPGFPINKNDEPTKILNNILINQIVSICGYAKGVEIKHLTFSQNDQWLASSVDSTIELWKPHEKTLMKLNNVGIVSILSFSSNAEWLASGSRYNRIVTLWRLPEGIRVKNFIYDPFVNNLNFSPCGNLLVAASYNDTKVKIWCISAADIQKQLCARYTSHLAGIECVSFSPDGQWLASGSSYYDKTAKLWRVENGELEKTFEHIRGSVSFSGKSQFLSLVSDYDPKNNGSVIQVWKIPEGRLESELREHEKDNFEGIAVFSPDGEWLASTTFLDKFDPRVIKLWKEPWIGKKKVTPEKLERKNFTKINGLCFSRNGEWLASWSKGQSDGSIIEVWNVKTKEYKVICKISADISDVSFSPGGGKLASASEDSKICIWQVFDGKLLESLNNSNSSLTSISFYKDGQWLASGGSYDGTIKLWNLDDLADKPKEILKGDNCRVSSINFSNDGKWLATGNINGDIKVWKIENLTRGCLRIFLYWRTQNVLFVKGVNLSGVKGLSDSNARLLKQLSGSEFVEPTIVQSDSMEIDDNQLLRKKKHSGEDKEDSFSSLIIKQPSSKKQKTCYVPVRDPSQEKAANSLQKITSGNSVKYFRHFFNPNESIGFGKSIAKYLDKRSSNSIACVNRPCFLFFNQLNGKNSLKKGISVLMRSTQTYEIKQAFPKKSGNSNKEREQQLIQAIRTGNMTQAKYWLEYNLDVNAKSATEEGTTALHWAIKLGDKAILELLLNYGGDMYETIKLKHF